MCKSKAQVVIHTLMHSQVTVVPQLARHQKSNASRPRARRRQPPPLLCAASPPGPHSTLSVRTGQASSRPELLAAQQDVQAAQDAVTHLSAHTLCVSWQWGSRWGVTARSREFVGSHAVSVVADTRGQVGAFACSGPPSCGA